MPATEIPQPIAEQSASRILGAGAKAHEDFITYGTLVHLNYLEEKNMVSLTESLGVREVTSKSGQQGIPIAGGAASA